MSIYTLGQFITMRREELGVTQDELCEGLCSTVTLSRLENGSQYPRAGTLRAILQRLGYSDALMLAGVSREEFEIAKLEVKIRQHYNCENLDAAREALTSLEAYRDYFSVTDRQFYESLHTLIYLDSIPVEETIEILLNTIKLTHPKFSIDNPPKLLTSEEASMLNTLACQLETGGKRNQAINLFYHLKRFYESNLADPHEMLRVFPTVLYNLSKLLGLSGRYDECIEVSLEGIRLMKSYARSRRLGKILYNLSWAMVKRGRPSDIEPAKQALKEAYCFALVIDNRPSFIERLKKFSIDNFGEELPSIF